MAEPHEDDEVPGGDAALQSVATPAADTGFGTYGTHPSAGRPETNPGIAESAPAGTRDSDGAFDPRSRPPVYEPMQIIEARLCIEPTLAGLCAQRATSGEVQALEALLVRAEAEPENDTWDASLHQTIAVHARSAVLQAAFAVIEAARASPGWQVALARARTPDHRATYRRQHVAIVDAICRRDSAGSAEAMASHIELLKRHMAFALGPR
jgi:hypothetical protein